MTLPFHRIASALAVKPAQSLFSGPMVRALLDGRKTQTRRLKGLKKVNEAPNNWRLMGESNGVFQFMSQDGDSHEFIRCPYGVPGDVLWVREQIEVKDGSEGYEKGIEYVADGAFKYCEADSSVAIKVGKRPSIHMPRWACRLYLEVVSVRVERLWDINEDDAEAEGCEAIPVTEADIRQTVSDRRTPQHIRDLAKIFGPGQFTAKFAFSNLWDSINGGGSWASNPFVWVVSFKCTEAP